MTKSDESDTLIALRKSTFTTKSLHFPCDINTKYDTNFVSRSKSCHKNIPLLVENYYSQSVTEKKRSEFDFEKEKKKKIVMVLT